MKAQLFLAVVACVGLSAQLFADDPGKTNTEEKTNPPAGRFTIVDRDWAGPIDAGQFLSAIAFSNQLGIDVAPVDPPLRAHLDLKEGQGVVVTSPAADGQSTTSNLKPHDVVLAIDGQQITGPEKFNELVGGRKGKIAMMHILRKGKPMDLEVTFPETPVYQFANQLAASNTLVWADNQYRIGVTLAQADDVLRSQLRLAEGEGLVITDIVADGPSAKAGLRKHDVLVKLDGKRLSTVEACNSQIQEIKDPRLDRRAAVFDDHVR
jgi:S1-C subfamily serine protease